MSADPKRIIVTECCCEACSVHTVRVHHEHFPEMRAEGITAEMAAGHLANRLASAQESDVDPAHRDAIRGALSDAQAFLGRKGRAHPGRDASGPHPS